MAYNDAYNFPKIYHMISVSNREIEGKIFNMINSFSPTIQPLLGLRPDLYMDYATMTLRDKNGRFVDNIEVKDGVNVDIEVDDMVDDVEDSYYI